MLPNIIIRRLVIAQNWLMQPWMDTCKHWVAADAKAGNLCV